MRTRFNIVSSNHPNKSFYFIPSICTVDLLIPNFRAAERTVAPFSMMYAANLQARSSIFPFKSLHSLSRFATRYICGRRECHACTVKKSPKSFFPVCLLHITRKGRICYRRVIGYETSYLENLRRLDPACRGGRRPVRLADPGWSKGLQPEHHPTASLTACHGISHRLGHSVRSDGNWGRSDLSDSPLP